MLSYLAHLGIFAWRQNQGMTTEHGRVRSFRGLKGVSDVLGILPDGRFLAIECKAATGNPSPEQIAFLEAIRARGGVAFVARSLEDVKAGLGRAA